MGDGGAGVGGVRQLVRGQRGHASGREAPREEVVECRQLVGSRLLTPASTAVTEPDLGASRVENGGLSLAPGGELRLSENCPPPPTSHHPPPSQHHPTHPEDIPTLARLGTVCRMLSSTWFHSVLASTPWQRYYHYPHFTDTHTRTQGEWVTCPHYRLCDSWPRALSAAALPAPRDVNR